MNILTIELEKTLGPGTSELKLRQGLHSGSVTAGVLRNDKSRFQLFGDTVRVECSVGICICNSQSSSLLSLSLCLSV
jgi:Adenylate and Guanylate cyclase catalytic domain